MPENKRDNSYFIKRLSETHGIYVFEDSRIKSKNASEIALKRRITNSVPKVKRSIRERFESHILKTDTCWLWSGAKRNNGYGKLGVYGETIGAHILSYIFNVGPIPSGCDICHSCDNPACVRPDHLWAGTPLQNMTDAKQKGRIRKGESSPVSKLSDGAVREIRASNMTNTALAKLFNVSQGNISQIRSRKAWKHVT